MSDNSNPSKPSSLSYKDAGVDINAGNALVQRIKGAAASTHRPEVLGNLGGFGALCEIPKGYENPILVSGTDGVGTKLRLALDMKKHDTVGIDLVAMCVNDLLAIGAEPLFFLDYYATSKLEVDVAADVIQGIAKGCQLSGCSLVGGETAEMPGMYHEGDYDLAGFCVGIVEKSKIIDANNINPGDAIIGVASSGPHSNGYSLIRKIIEVSGANLDQPFGDGSSTLGEQLLIPTKLYVSSVLSLQKAVSVNGVANITGGGIIENVPRVLPKNTCAEIDTQSWEKPEIFQWLQAQGNVDDTEMLRTFNCGIGLVLVIPEAEAQKALDHLKAEGETALRIGTVKTSEKSDDEPYVELKGL